MSKENDEINKFIADSKHDSQILEELLASYKKEAELHAQIDKNEKIALELLKNPTKENLEAVRDYIKKLCANFKIPFKEN